MKIQTACPTFLVLFDICMAVINMTLRHPQTLTEQSIYSMLYDVRTPSDTNYWTVHIQYAIWRYDTLRHYLLNSPYTVCYMTLQHPQTLITEQSTYSMLYDATTPSDTNYWTVHIQYAICYDTLRHYLLNSPYTVCYMTLWHPQTLLTEQSIYSMLYDVTTPSDTTYWTVHTQYAIWRYDTLRHYLLNSPYTVCYMMLRHPQTLLTVQSTYNTLICFVRVPRRN
jgi:hypothetical protein